MTLTRDLHDGTRGEGDVLSKDGHAPAGEEPQALWPLELWMAMAMGQGMPWSKMLACTHPPSICRGHRPLAQQWEQG